MGVPDMPMAAYPIHPFCFCSLFLYLPFRFVFPPFTVSLHTGRIVHDSRGEPNNSSSEIGSDKVILLHNKAHGEAEKTEGKISRRYRRHKRVTERCNVRGSFFFGDKHYS